MKLKTDVVVHYHSVDYELPEKIDEDFAWWLGVFYGDGSVAPPKKGCNPRQLEITCTEDEPEIMNRVIQITKKLFDCDCKIEQDKRSKGIHVHIPGRKIVAFLELNGLLKEKSLNIAVPSAILKASKRVKNAFISGYWDADGTVAVKNGTIDSFRAKSISFDFIDQIETILQTSKIDCYTSDYKGYSHYSKYHGYEITHQPCRTLRVRSNSTQLFCDLMKESVKVQQVQEKLELGKLRIPNFRKKNRFLND